MTLGKIPQDLVKGLVAAFLREFQNLSDYPFSFIGLSRSVEARNDSTRLRSKSNRDSSHG
jgi:hypothetical protein